MIMLPPGFVRVDGAGGVKNERGAAGGEGVALGFGLAVPAEVVALGLAHKLGINDLLQLVHVELTLVAEKVEKSFLSASSRSRLWSGLSGRKSFNDSLMAGELSV